MTTGPRAQSALDWTLQVWGHARVSELCQQVVDEASEALQGLLEERVRYFIEALEDSDLEGVFLTIGRAGERLEALPHFLSHSLDLLLVLANKDDTVMLQDTFHVA